MKTIILSAGLLLVASGAAAVDAKQLYEEKCKVCHSLGGEAGPMAAVGGPLDGVGSKRDEAWLRAYFADPTSKIPEAKMPKLDLTAEQWDAMVEYMLSLKAE